MLETLAKNVQFVPSNDEYAGQNESAAENTEDDTQNERTASTSEIEDTFAFVTVILAIWLAATDADNAESNPTSSHEAVANDWLPAATETVWSFTEYPKRPSP